MVLMLLLGTSSAWAKVIYFKANGSNNWASDGAVIQVKISNSWKAMTCAYDGYYVYDIGSNTKVIFGRGSAVGSIWNQSAEITVGSNVTFTPNGWSDCTMTTSTSTPTAPNRVVAGSKKGDDKNASIFGTAWSPTTTSNKMTFDASIGKFKKEYLTNFTSNEEIAFKVTDGSWSNSWGNNGSNYEYTIASGCKKITIIFSECDKNISVSIEDSDHCCTTPSAPQISGATSICSGESAEITVSGYSSSNTYTLYKGTDKQTNTISNTGKFTVNSTGKYYVTVTTCAESAMSNEVEISAKAVASAAGYTLKTKTAEWNDSAISVEIETNSGYPSIENIYYGGSLEAPSAVGTYPITIDVNSNSTYCSKSGVEIGTFTITCPAPAEVPKFEVTQHEVVCGNTNIQKGIIKITNPVADYKYRLGNEGNTEYTLDANNSITGIDGGTKYRISAVRYCGTAKSSTTNEEKYAEISKTDVKLTPTLTSTPIIKCGEGDNAYSPGTLVITNYNANYDYTIAPNVGEPTIEGTNATYSINAQVATEYTVIATHKEYNCSSVQAKTTVALTDNTPTLEEISISSNVQIVRAGDNNVTLTCNLVGAVGTPTYKWTKNGEPVGDNSNTIQAGVLERNTTFSVSVILDNSGCTKEFTISKELEVKVRPEAPNLGSTGKTICYGTLVNLPMVDNNDANNQINWYNGKLVKPTNVSVLETTTFYAEAVSEEGLGCPSVERTPYIVTVNPLPTIGIKKTEPATIYKYADVKLKANGDNISTVVWNKDKGTITRQPNYPDETKRAMLTYDQAGTVTVTATATSEAGCVATSSEFPVVFGEEDCAPTTTTTTETVIDTDKMEIWCREVSGSNVGANLKCYAWDNNDTKIFGNWNGGTTKTTKTYNGNTYRVWEINNISTKYTLPIKVIFSYIENNSTYQTDDMATGDAGHKYTYWYNKSGDGNANKGKQETVFAEGDDEITKTVTTEIPVPAVKVNPTIKTVSVTSNEDGEVTLNGMVVATGCNDQAKLGLQYKKQNQDDTWPDAYLTEEPNTKENISKGKTFTTTTTLEDGTYKVRACAHADGDLKGYGYDVIITVSAVKTPITTVTLTHVKDQQGTPYTAQELQNLTYCVGDEVWFKLEQDGSDFKEYKWVSYPGTGLKGMYSGGTFKFTITGNGFVAIKLRNDVNVDNEGNATWVESNELEFNTHPESISPTISFEETPICSNKTATLNLGALVVGQKYELYEQIENDGTYSEERVGNTTLTCNSVEDKLQFTGLNKSGKYFVKAYTESCPNNLAPSQTATLEVVDESSVNISITPSAANTTPWMPVKLTVSATDNYTITVPDGVEYSQKGDVVSVKIPLPAGATGGEGQYENVAFPQDAVTSYTITANLATTGGSDNPCASPASATITLVPYEEPCVTEHNN